MVKPYTQVFYALARVGDEGIYFLEIYKTEHQACSDYAKIHSLTMGQVNQHMMKTSHTVVPVSVQCLNQTANVA